MTLRLTLPRDLERERSIDVDQAAQILGCDQATVRALLRAGAIDGHRVGKTDRPGGVRVNLQSVRDYKVRHPIAGDVEEERPGPAAQRRRPPSSAAHNEAMTQLRALGSRL